MASPPAEVTTLNIEKEEKQLGTLELAVEAEPKDDKTKVNELKEKLKKPTIGASLVVFLIINTVMLVVGVTTTKDCPIQPNIPIYLAVAGALGIVTKIIPIANRNRRIVVVDRILFALLLVEFIWMIVGSYWIYSIYQPPYAPHYEYYCNKTAYLLAFWLLTLHYIFLLLMIMVPCCILSCVCWGCWAMMQSD